MSVTFCRCRLANRSGLFQLVSLSQVPSAAPLLSLLGFPPLPLSSMRPCALLLLACGLVLCLSVTDVAARPLGVAGSIQLRHGARIPSNQLTPGQPDVAHTHPTPPVATVVPPADPDTPAAEVTRDSPFALNVDDACNSCCNGGACTYTEHGDAAGVPAASQVTVIKSVQCCGKLANKAMCCAAPSGASMFTAQKCSAGENGYTCENVRSLHHMMAQSAYLSVGGLVVIIVIGALLVCCYMALASRRSHARYYGLVINGMHVEHPQAQ